jgi:hypothetical protein
MARLKMLTSDAKLAEIRRLYFNTTRQTIQRDLAAALELLKSMDSEEERERATVFMEGLAQMMNHRFEQADQRFTWLVGTKVATLVAIIAVRVGALYR